jgi:hypothetical protein
LPEADSSVKNRDQVEWGAAEEEFAQQALEKQRNSPVPQHLQEEFNANPAEQWNKFYAVNKGAFLLPSVARTRGTDGVEGVQTISSRSERGFALNFLSWRSA